MPVLSAKALTADPKGLSRLKAVIATDPGYETRAQHVADSIAASGAPELPQDGEAVSCDTLKATSVENAPAADRIVSLVTGGMVVAGSAIAGFVALALPVRDGSTALL